jgi:hypothetical protein
MPITNVIESRSYLYDPSQTFDGFDIGYLYTTPTPDVVFMVEGRGTRKILFMMEDARGYAGRQERRRSLLYEEAVVSEQANWLYAVPTPNVVVSFDGGAARKIIAWVDVEVNDSNPGVTGFFSDIMSYMG